MLSLDELIREGEAIRAEEIAMSSERFREHLREKGLPEPARDPAIPRIPKPGRDFYIGLVPVA